VDLNSFVEEEGTMRVEVSLADTRLMDVFADLSVLIEVSEFLQKLPAVLTHKQHDRDCQHPG
jgi:hypothetical protein